MFYLSAKVLIIFQIKNFFMLRRVNSFIFNYR
nr:MAG TPA: hypothetical protein [Caudoviricetes sp.]